MMDMIVETPRRGVSTIMSIMSILSENLYETSSRVF